MSVRDDLNNNWDDILNDYWAGESVRSIAKRTGYDPSTVHKRISIDKAQNGDRGTRPKSMKDARAYENKKAISNRHGSIGTAVALTRAAMRMSPSAFGLEIQKSNSKVRNIEIGCHDLTLSEIDRIAEVLGISFEDLVLGKIQEKKSA